MAFRCLLEVQGFECYLGRDGVRLPLSETPPRSPEPTARQQEWDDRARAPTTSPPPLHTGYQSRPGGKYSNDPDDDAGLGVRDAEERRLEELQRSVDCVLDGRINEQCF